MTIAIIRKPQAAAMAGVSKTTLYEQTKAGIFPPPVPLGGRAVGYFKHEIEAVLAARSIGKSDDELRELVNTLVERRKVAANNLASYCAA